VRRVEVEWIDPTAVFDGWTKIEDIKDDDLRPATCSSVGYVYEENDEVLVLVCSQGFRGSGRDLEELGDGLVLPRCVIRSISELRSTDGESTSRLQGRSSEDC